MTAEEFKPLWNWAYDNTIMYSVVDDLWGEGSVNYEAYREAHRKCVESGPNHHDMWAALNHNLTPEMRARLADAILAKRLTS